MYKRTPSSHRYCSLCLLLLLLHPCYWLPNYQIVDTALNYSSGGVVKSHNAFWAVAATKTKPLRSDEERLKDENGATSPSFYNIRSFIFSESSQSDSPSPSSNLEVGDVGQSKKASFSQILTNAGKRGIGGGIPGAVAGAVQVLTLMWLRTVINYQCRYGTTFRQALTTLYNQGGLPRFYRGLAFAIIQAPLARFVSTAANDGVEALLGSLQATKHWGPGRNTVVASIVVGMWRVMLMPIDTCKTVLQVDSAEGFRNLMRKVRAGKIHVLYQGAAAQVVSAVVAHYPWFYTYNFLSRHPFVQNLFKSSLLRNGVIGLASSIVSDVLVNVVRVIKTTKQAIASKHTVTYGETIAMILAADGWKGLFGRGLKTRIMANALQSVVFTIIWRGLAQHWNSSEKSDNDNKDEKRPSHMKKNYDGDKSSRREDEQGDYLELINA